MNRANSVWVSPSATAFSCLCETCLDRARGEGTSFLEAIRRASVRSNLFTETGVRFPHCCRRYHLVRVIRRIDRPAPLTRHDVRQLQLV